LKERTFPHPSSFFVFFFRLEGPYPAFEGFRLPLETVKVMRTMSSASNSAFNVGTWKKEPSAKASLPS